MKNKPTVYDFPVTEKTKNLKIWRNLDIEQKGLIDIGNNERLYESIIIPFLYEKNKLKILSKINIKTSKITYVIRSNNLITDLRTVSNSEYKTLVRQLEEDLEKVLDIPRKQILTGEEMYKEIFATNHHTSP